MSLSKLLILSLVLKADATLLLKEANYKQNHLQACSVGDRYVEPVD